MKRPSNVDVCVVVIASKRTSLDKRPMDNVAVNFEGDLRPSVSSIKFRNVNILDEEH